MVRGTIPRQPAKTGRHEGARRIVKPSAPLRTYKTPPLAKPAPRLRSGQAPGRAPKSTSKYDPLAPERVREILKRLDERYPKATCALHHRSAWELLVATILSAQCTDVRVNMVTPVLFQKYPTVQHFAALKPEELEPDIRSTGFFRNKAKSVVGAARKLVSDFGGEVPNDMEKLLSLPGVARKTANVVLGTWFHNPTGVVVDTHVTRVSHRLELTRQENAEKIEQDLMKIVPRERWIDFSHQVIWHGRQLCMARSPKCAECPLENLCHAADKTWSTVEIHKDAKP
ncbi:MAG: endonuclease III [Terriglobales bacterium]